MAQEVCVVVGTEDRARLAAIVGNRSRPVKHVQRCRIVLFSADRLPVIEVARRAGVSRPAVWRWQCRCAEAGVGGSAARQEPAAGQSAGRPRHRGRGAGPDLRHILTQGTAIRSLMRNPGGSVGISILVTKLAQNTQVIHSRLLEGLRPDNPIVHAPFLRRLSA